MSGQGDEMPVIERAPVWMVERQAFGGHYWERVTFGPFASREEAEKFTRSPYGGTVYDAARSVERWIICPECKGHGQPDGDGSGHDGGGSYHTPACARCDGRGEVLADA